MKMKDMQLNVFKKNCNDTWKLQNDVQRIGSLGMCYVIPVSKRNINIKLHLSL